MKLLQILVKDIIILHFLLFFTTASYVSWHADANKRARLECKHSLKNADIITWQKNNTQIVYKSATDTKISKGFDLEVEEGEVYLIIEKVNEEHMANYKCTVYDKSYINDYRTISGYLQVRDLSHPIRSSLSALLFGCLLQAVLLGL